MLCDCDPCIADFDRQTNDLPGIIPVQWKSRRMDWDQVFSRIAWLMERPDTGLVTKARLNPRHWSVSRLAELIHRNAEMWCFDKNSAVIAIWPCDVHESTPPLGFVAFSFKCHRRNRRASFHSVYMDLKFAWVRPDARGYGAVAAQHLAAHLVEYLGCVNFDAAGFLTKDAYFTLGASFYTRGGQKFFQIVENGIGVLANTGIWRFAEYDDDVSYDYERLRCA